MSTPPSMPWSVARWASKPPSQLTRKNKHACTVSNRLLGSSATLPSQRSSTKNKSSGDVTEFHDVKDVSFRAEELRSSANSSGRRNSHLWGRQPRLLRRRWELRSRQPLVHCSRPSPYHLSCPFPCLSQASLLPGRRQRSLPSWRRPWVEQFGFGGTVSGRFKVCILWSMLGAKS